MQLSRFSQSGGSLLEVLVSILILSIGLLGMVGMVVGSFKAEQMSMTRSMVADTLANIADRMRANSDPALPVEAYAYSNTYSTERASIDGNSSFLVPATDCVANVCTSAEMAAFDLAEWRSYLNRQLPAAVGHVETAGTRGIDLRYIATVAWADVSKADEPAADTEKRECSAATNAIGVGARSCCPNAISHTAGIVCSRMEIIP